MGSLAGILNLETSIATHFQCVAVSPRASQLVFQFGPGAELGYPRSGDHLDGVGSLPLEAQLQAIIDLGADTTSEV